MALYEPEEIIPEQSFGSKLLEGVTTPIVGLLDILDIPGSYTRGLLAGKGFERTSGRQLLDAWGVLPKGSGFDWAGLGAEFIDPLMFMGSITGLTKVGKAAKASEALWNESKVIRNTLLHTPDADQAFKKVLETKLAEINKKSFKLTGVGIDDVSPKNWLKSSTVEQVKAGQRGATLSVPFMEGEAKLPSFMNEAFEKYVRPSLPELKAPPGLKKLFDSSKKSILGDVSKYLEDQATHTKLIDTDNRLVQISKEVDDEIQKISVANDITTKEATERLHSDIVSVQEAIGQPEKIRQMEDELVKLEKERKDLILQRASAKYDKLIKENPNQAAELTEQWNKEVLSKEKKLQIKIAATRRKFANARIKFQHIMDTVGTDGSLPRKMAEEFKKAGEDNLALLKAYNIAITGLDDIVGYVPHILSQEGQLLFRQDKDFQRFVGKTVISSIPGFIKKRTLRGQTLAEINKKIASEWGIENAFLTDPFAMYKAREIGTQLAVNRARTAATAVHMHAIPVHKLRDLIQVVREGGGVADKPVLSNIAKEGRNKYVPLADFLKETGMSQVMLNGKKVEWGVAAGAKRSRKDIHAALKKEGFGKWGIPVDVYNDVIRSKKILFDSDNNFWKTWDFTNDTFRTYLTSFHPSHIGTNTAGNTFMNLIALGPVDTIKYTAIAAKHLAASMWKRYKGAFQGVEDILYHGTGPEAARSIESSGKLVSGASELLESSEKGFIWASPSEDVAKGYSAYRGAGGQVFKTKLPEGAKILDAERKLTTEEFDKVKHLIKEEWHELFKNKSIGYINRVIRDHEAALSGKKLSQEAITTSPSTFLKEMVQSLGYQGIRREKDSIDDAIGAGIGIIADELPIVKPPSEYSRLTREFLDMGSGGSSYPEMIFGKNKKGARFNSKWWNSVSEKILSNPITEAGFFVNQFSEQTAKLAHYLAMVDRGETSIDAMRSVKKYLFDYGQLTDFERQVMRRTVLFYTFMRKNLPLAVTETIANRRAYSLGKTSAATLRTEDFVPAYVRDTGSIAVGNDVFVDVKNPLFEANRFGSQGQGPLRVLERAVGSMVPSFKIPFELATGRETFRGRPLDNRVRQEGFFPASKLPFTETFLDKSGQPVTTMNKYALQVLRNLPTSRIQQTVGDITDPEILFGPSLFGPRARKLPYEERKQRALISALQAELGADPRVRKFEDYYSVAKETPERTQILLDQLRRIKASRQ